MNPEARVITNDLVVDEVADRFRKDEAFKTLLKRDAKAAVESLGIRVPEDAEIRVEGDTPATERLVVYSPQIRELTDEDLLQVTGGLVMPSYKLRLPVFRAVALYDVGPAGLAGGPVRRF